MSKRKRRTNRLDSQIDELTAGAPDKRGVTVIGNDIVEQATLVVTIRKTPIMWGIPCDELGYSKFWIHFERHANRMPWDAFAGSEGTYLRRARNSIHNAFIDSDLPYLMMLDSDILFPPNIADKLMAYNLPIVGGWYRDKNSPDHHPVVYDYAEESEDGISNWHHRTVPGKGLERVGGMGAGCWLLSRDTAVALGKDPYGTNLGGGEDMIFSRKLIELGIPLHVDWNINCAHVGVSFV